MFNFILIALDLICDLKTGQVSVVLGVSLDLNYTENNMNRLLFNYTSNRTVLPYEA